MPQQVKERADGAKRLFEAQAKAWDPYGSDPKPREELEASAKKAIRVYLQVGA
jgi:hypothetical protein